ILPYAVRDWRGVQLAEERSGAAEPLARRPAVQPGASLAAAGIIVRVVGAHERAHVAFLRQTLGSRAKAAPTFDFGDAVTDPDRFAGAARVLEDLGVAALDGQAANLTKPSLAV